MGEVLVFLSDKGRVFVFDGGQKEIVLGRGADCSFVFDDKKLSKRHCRFVLIVFLFFIFYFLFFIFYFLFIFYLLLFMIIMIISPLFTGKKFARMSSGEN